MNELELFVESIVKTTKGNKKLSIEQQRDILYQINSFLYTTNDDLETTYALGENFAYFSDYHKYWEENHKKIINFEISEEQCEKVADVLHAIYVSSKGKAFKQLYDTCELEPEEVFKVRFLTANQDFRGSRDFSELAKIYKKDKSIFNAQSIIRNPGAFINSLKITNLSQTDKRSDFAKNVAEFYVKYGSDSSKIIEAFENNLSKFRKALISNPNTGYGNKKTDMLIRDMVIHGVWDNAKGFETIDVASDVNTIKIALRTGILKPSIPLLSSFMDIFCYQYAYTDEMSAKAWRRVWEIWKNKYSTECIESPCLMDYFIYNIVGRKICKENLTRYLCEECHNEFYWHTSRKSVCTKCHGKNLNKEKMLPCQSENGNVVIDYLKSEANNSFLKLFDNCPFQSICNIGGNINLQPPKSISIKGNTSWSDAYTDKKQGGGGLMA